MFRRLDALVFVTCVVIHLAFRYRRKRVYPLPPGQRGWPLIGNALEMPQKGQHKYFKALGQRLGSKIFHLKAFNQYILVINDVRMAQDLLDKRSALYSSRPVLTMLSEVMGINYFFPFMTYGDEWRNHRRIFQQYFSTKNLGHEESRAIDFVRKGLLPNLFETPEMFTAHLVNLIGGLTAASTYGVPIRRIQDELVQTQEYIYGLGEVAATPGRFLVDIIPALKYVPEWMPGAGFKVLGKRLGGMLAHIVEEPYRRSLKGIEEGTTNECFVSWSLENNTSKPDREAQLLRIKQVAGAIYPGGTDTRVACSRTFIFAMLLNPDVQRKAQAEIDAVVGHERLPDYSDRSQLPYLCAILKETLRWNPLLPLGVPHLTSVEDVYDGFYIPAGAVVFGNIHAMLHDEETFPNPEVFDPERFLNQGDLRTDILDPEVVATFGFGRRICPGARIALSTLYLIIASILALFDITPELDSEGRPIKVSPEFAVDSIISQPVNFRCKITPRKCKDVEGLLKDYMGFEVI